MSDLRTILTQITELTTIIETDYPELHQFLDEDPMTIPAMQDPEIDKDVMQIYLDELKQMLKQYSKTHGESTK